MRDNDYRTAVGRIGAYVFGIYVVGTMVLLLGTAVALDQQRLQVRRWLGREGGGSR